MRRCTGVQQHRQEMLLRTVYINVYIGDNPYDPGNNILAVKLAEMSKQGVFERNVLDRVQLTIIFLVKRDMGYYGILATPPGDAVTHS